jgi:hypothetical protein
VTSGLDTRASGRWVLSEAATIGSGPIPPRFPGREWARSPVEVLAFGEPPSAAGAARSAWNLLGPALLSLSNDLDDDS